MTRLLALVLAIAGIAAAAPAAAHPHIFIDGRTELVFEAGRLVAVRHAWRFDEAFSAWISQGLDANGDGQLDQAELAPLAKVNVESLKEFDYFTFFRVGGKLQGFKLPSEYFLVADDGRLTLYYSLPLKEPLAAAGKDITVEVFDPTYFVDFKLVDDEPAKLVGAPAACRLAIARPGALDAGTASVLGQIPATERELPANLLAVTRTLANRLTVNCP